MIIEYSNAQEPRIHHSLSVAIVIASSAFFFIPTTLIILGYLSSQPTGSLISPLPQGTLSQNAPSPSPTQATTLTPNVANGEVGPLIAAPNDATDSAVTDITPLSGSNIIDKTASISATLSEAVVTDPDIMPDSQIYLSPRPQDTATYSVKSKSTGQMTIEVNPVSDLDRYIDYHIVSP